jgi:hypothetical protein
MEWILGVFFAVMIGLYIWSTIPARRALTKKIQPLVDDLFGSHPRPREKTVETKLPTNADRE